MFDPGDDVIVEWRGVTVGFLDRLCLEVNRALRNELQGGELSLAQLLEAGSWKVSQADDSPGNESEYLTCPSREDARWLRCRGPTPRSLLS